MRKSDTENYDVQEEQAHASKPPRSRKPPKEKKSKRHKEPGGFKRSFRDVLKSRITIGIICVVVPLLVVFVGGPIVQGIVSERVPVVVAKSNIERGSYITGDMVDVQEIGAVDRPQNAVQEQSLVIGGYAIVDISHGDIITTSKIIGERPLENPYLYDLPEGKQAISVEVKGLAEGLTAKLKEGDIISIYATFSQSDAETDYSAVQPPELKYVRVLAVSNSSAQDIDVDAPIQAEGAEQEKIPATITLLVGELQAASLAGLNADATIHASLAARGDNTGLCDALLELQQEYITELEEEMKEKEEGSEEAPAADSESSVPQTEDISPEGEEVING